MGTHNIWDAGGIITGMSARNGKTSFQLDYNPSSPSAPSSTNYDTVTQSAIDANPQWFNFKPLTSSTTYQALATESPSIQYPNGRTLYLKTDFTLTYDSVNGFIGTLTPFQSVYVNNYDPSRSGVIKYGTLPFNPSDFTLITDNSDINHRPVWYREFGSDYNSSNIPYGKETLSPSYGFPEIILRDASDLTQPEFDISSNPLITAYSQYTNTYDSNGVCYMEKLGAYTALRTPNNDTPYVMRNQVMKFDLLSNIVDGCPDACWHSNKVVKIKLKYQKGTVSIYKNAGQLVQSGYSTVQASIQILWNDYEDEIVDNIDIFFDHTENGQDCGILWSKEIECPAGQAKRLVDVCVLEIRDKT
jgi:hypothetical protein